MNKHIYKVIKWLEDPESVSQEERDKNREEAYSYYASDYFAAFSAYSAAYYVAEAAAKNKPEEADSWVNVYLERAGKNKQDYLDAIKEDK